MPKPEIQYFWAPFSWTGVPSTKVASNTLVPAPKTPRFAWLVWARVVKGEMPAVGALPVPSSR